METIVALATSPMNCAIHIIRVSGFDTYYILNAIIDKPIVKKGYQISRRTIIDGHQIIDDVLISKFVNPKSYTGEDLVEINCHGGLVVANQIIKLLIKHGAVLAMPGEFSKRSFLNNKIDLNQVESIDNLIHAKNELATKGAITGVMGSVSHDLEELHNQLFNIIAAIEINIDYPEYDDVPTMDITKIKLAIQWLINKTTKMVEQSKIFQPINNGIKLAIVGKPNVGKSSLLNALIKQDKAIVSNIAGTTRDVVEASININNITLQILDTAGLRESKDKIEKMGISKTKEIIRNADLVLYLLDGSSKLDSLDKANIKLIKDKPHFIVVNKKDLLNKTHKTNDKHIYISAKHNQVSDLVKAIENQFMVNKFNKIDFHILQSTRQIGLMSNVVELLTSSLYDINHMIPIDMVITKLEVANIRINEILGVGANYDILDELFSKFCLGK